MTYYACITIGMADFLPDRQDYVSADTIEEFAAIIKGYCDEFDEHESEEGHGTPYRYNFRIMPDWQDNYSQRLRIGRDRDWVLDVIGMTAESWHRESAE